VPGGEMTAIANFRDVVDANRATTFRSRGWWGDVTVGDLIATHAATRPDQLAFATDAHHMTWSQYHHAARRLAGALLSTDLEPGEPVAVLLPDGPTAHVAYVANELAGTVTIGVGARAGESEIRHFLRRTGACALISHARHREFETEALFKALAAEGIPLRHHIVVPAIEVTPTAPVIVNGQSVASGSEPGTERIDARRIGPDDLFMINSTSGTTGLPKCVMHTENSKLYMAAQARDVGQLGEDEVVFGGAPIPFGFGLFTTHFVPPLLGATTVVTNRFTPELTLELIERERVTVLVCVSTQFKMLLNSPDMATRDLSSLKVMFTGGEMIPFAAAREFEERTGAYVLNFYGSNESGVATGTRVSDPIDKRLRTGGSYLEGTEVHLFDEGRDVTETGRGQPGSRGPAICLGYYEDPKANAELFTADGFVLHADICTIDADGYLSVVGRKSDLIIRGGKNISAAVVEDEVSAHPAVALAAAVPVQDPLFGERVGVYVELRPNTTLALSDLTAFLEARGASKELMPEYLFVVSEIPRSTGSKVAKSALREDAARRVSELLTDTPVDSDTNRSTDPQEKR
jgi:acyl-CoA synthetase